MAAIVLWLVTVVVVAVHSASAGVIESEWEVGYKFWWPDCKEGIVMAINGKFPGPTINAVAGDTLIIHVTNKLSTEGVVIHWHGIRQIGTPWADGAAGVTQCAISPGETFTYNFTVDKAGTHFYHGHYGMQRSAGLYGMLVVRSPKERLRYDGEFNLLLSDWWHQSIHLQELLLSSSPMRWIGEPHSLLINGRGQSNCSQAAYFNKGGGGYLKQCTFRENDQCAPETLRVELNRVYRLRIASTTALASLNLAVEGHQLEVVEADGNYVAPFKVNDIDIYSGETYSVLLRTNSIPSTKHWISVGVRGRKPNTTQALTVLHYVDAPDAERPIHPPPVTPRWDDYDRSKSFSKKIFAAKGYPPPPDKSDDQLILLNTQNLIDNYTKWAINNVSLSVPATPYLGSIRYKLSAYDLKSPGKVLKGDYDIRKPPVNPNTTKGSGIYNFPSEIVVDVILQNANVLNGKISEIHPWHLHGHDFWVLGYGEGKFKPGIDEKTYNLKNPPLRNTVALYPFGWTALRFVTDNPGVWFFHCHIEPHLHMGMGVVFAEGVDRIVEMNIPDEALGCGLTRKWLMNRGRR